MRLPNLSQRLSIPKSDAEEKCKIGFKRFGMSPEHNYQVDFFYIDFAFPDRKVGIEVDSWEWHKDKEKDQRRHDYLESRGWKIYHFMAKIIYQNPNVPAAYVYLKQFGENKELVKVANYEIFKLTRFYMTDGEIEREMNKILQ